MTKLFTIFKKQSPSQLLHLGFFIALLIAIPKFSSLDWRLKGFLAVLSVLLLVFNQKNLFTVSLLTLTLVFIGFEIYINYYVTANHVFLLFYMALLLFMVQINTHNASQIIFFNAKALLSLVLFFGGLQKVLSESFWNGDLMHYMFMRGELAQPLFQMDFFQDYFSENRATISTFKKSFSNPDDTLFLKPLIDSQSFIFYMFSLFVIFIEFLLAVFVWIKNERVKFFSFALFLVGLLLTRLETGFASLLCLLLLVQLPSGFKKIKTFYALLFLICSLLIVSGIGLH
jgi:hypothetical protein